MILYLVSGNTGNNSNNGNFGNIDLSMAIIHKLSRLVQYNSWLIYIKQHVTYVSGESGLG